jgi:hypothetical protein
MPSLRHFHVVLPECGAIPSIHSGKTCSFDMPRAPQNTQRRAASAFLAILASFDPVFPESSLLLGGWRRLGA